MKERLTKEDVGFTQVKNEVLSNPKLSLKAKGLFGLLYSKPDNWDFSATRLAAECLDGEKAIWSALKELEDAGYLKRHRQPNGRMLYEIFWNPNRQNGSQAQEPNRQNGKQPKRQTAEIGSISNTTNTSNTKEISNTLSASAEKDVAAVIDLFKEINPAYQTLFGRTPQRNAAARLLKLHPLEWWQRFMEGYKLALSNRYCPKAFTPVQLEQNLGRILTYAHAQKESATSGKYAVGMI